jgi:hypothetical protein
MNRKLLLLLLLSVSVFANAEPKTIKIKHERGVKFFYDTDSSVIDHKESTKLFQTFYHFYNAIYENDTTTYFNLLSPATHKSIPKSQLNKKFERYKTYVCKLVGKLQIEWIKILPDKFIETEIVYMCMIRLPAGVLAHNRVGFDPAKRFKKDDESYIGLMIVHLEDEYKVVIPW